MKIIAAIRGTIDIKVTIILTSCGEKKYITTIVGKYQENIPKTRTNNR